MKTKPTKLRISIAEVALSSSGTIPTMAGLSSFSENSFRFIRIMHGSVKEFMHFVLHLLSRYRHFKQSEETIKMQWCSKITKDSSRVAAPPVAHDLVDHFLGGLLPLQ